MMGARWELNLDRETFLAQYWQRKPLLIRNAIPGFQPPLSSDELAGLALEADIESRLIECKDDNWTLHHGPFDAADFQRTHPWTLLVQAVDHYIPAVASLRKLIEFIPQWRVDDVMVSYAVEGGSVGPHFDNYDVFLLQGSGERLWKLGQHCDETTALQAHDELRILDNFEASEEHLLRCGDILYVPPGVAHWGIAQTECTTFSIGFRAPRLPDMVSRWVDELLETLNPDHFYQDAKRAPAVHPGEIQSQDVQRAMTQLQSVLDQFSGKRWFGELVTEARYTPAQDDDDLAEARALLKEGSSAIELSPASKLAWQQDAAEITVFANGESQAFAVSVLPSLLILCETWSLSGANIAKALADPETTAMLDYLLESGAIYVS